MTIVLGHVTDGNKWTCVKMSERNLCYFDTSVKVVNARWFTPFFSTHSAQQLLMVMCHAALSLAIHLCIYIHSPRCPVFVHPSLYIHLYIRSWASLTFHSCPKTCRSPFQEAFHDPCPHLHPPVLERHQEGGCHQLFHSS